MFGSTEGRGGERMNFNGGEGRGDILIKYMFVSKEGREGEGKIWFTRGGDFKSHLIFHH